MVKIGDRVKFLNEKGGGRVSGFRGKDVVLVEDEDGFDVPMAVAEVVVVDESDSYDTTRMVKAKVSSPAAGTVSGGFASGSGRAAQGVAPTPPSHKVEERRGGDLLSAFIAFVPIDIKELTQTRFEAFLVNDSNYYLSYTLSAQENGSWRLRHSGVVEPNTKEFLEEFGREDLGGMERLAVQAVAYKRDRSFMLKPAIDVQLHVDPVKFYKLHTFRDNDFFEQPALLYTIIENDRLVRPLVVDAKRLKEEMYAGGSASTVSAGFDVGKADHATPEAMARRGAKGDSPMVVDLHASELLETTAGMSPADILNHQLDVFRQTLRDHAKEKGLRIVFIHGKGEGVLRRALINELQYRFKTCRFQDASFQEYGYGATQVTVG